MKTEMKGHPVDAAMSLEIKDVDGQETLFLDGVQLHHVLYYAIAKNSGNPKRTAELSINMLVRF